MSRVSRRDIGRLGLLAGASIVLGRCGPGEETQTGNRAAASAGEMVLNRGNAAEPQTLDPHLITGNWESDIEGDLIIGLTAENARGEAVAGAAERWETSEDGLTWTFHLRDHQWSDGKPVTADDFVFAWRRILDPKLASTSAYFLHLVKNGKAVNTGKLPPTALGVSAPDAKTLVVNLEYPAPYLVQMLTHSSLHPVPRHVVEAKGNAWTRPGSYVGNGAYTLSEWVPNDRVTLLKNPRFYDAQNVKIDRVVFHPTSDYEAALRRLRAGELDMQSKMPTGRIDWIRANIPETIDPKPILTVEYYPFNLARKPLQDVRVREALSLALDRETLQNKVVKVGYPPAYSIVPPGTANYPGGVALPFKDMPFPQRLERARQLMQDAGYGPNKPFKTTMSVRSASAEARRVPAAIQEMWRQIFVDAEIVQMDAAVFYNQLRQHDFDIGLAGWVGDFNDAANFLDLFRTGNTNNNGQYRNPAYDALLDRANLERDLGRRGELLAEAEALMLRDHPLIPSFFAVSTNLVQPYVKGWITNINNSNRTRWLWVERAAERQP
jgi:oligopeptide transport system substrate-binding protein